ncbi:hypothetical protein GCM10011351_26260 [Paraliobacillus quinghaiensis]|uniref:PepSY domain-containing protein n=1 Tax=Paraliobacillus quinghaiensis TaxID=470815 RepID=A0A917TUH9_9BACI|nr:hypothetical protein [Paraliobacillus quinghaiensis]GGM38862.1 hypothetical protein GCM10011351_26260 [Paraliobacillus quinghaiensis]
MRKFLYLLFIITIGAFFIVACSPAEDSDVTTDPDEQTNEEANNDSSTDQTEDDNSNNNDSDENTEGSGDNEDSENTNETDESDESSDSDENQNSENESNTDKKEEITEEDAVTIVREKLDISVQSETIVEVDHRDDLGDYVVHVYDIVETEEASHTATIGWYIVDAEDGTVENMME